MSEGNGSQGGGGEGRRAPTGEYGLPESVPCPFCDGAETELHSPFGTALSVATYWCRRCHTAFEWVKWRGADEE